MSRFKFGDWVKTPNRVGQFIAAECDGESRWAMVFVDGTVSSALLADLTPYTPPAPAGTVPVRIAVAVKSDGQAHAVQIHDYENEDEVKQHAAEDLLGYEPGFCRVSVLKGDMPLPQPPAEVAGVVEGGGE